ncbi:MAG: dihydrofolate reductase family protein [Mucilaginibacter sp.]|nr:dihydrofolate reductase family protein [Mucilaginibacter sp.]
MRKLKLQVHMTVDGFGSRKNGQNDWVFASGPDEIGFQKLIELAETCDTVLLGHNMAPMFLGHWQNMADSEPQTQQKTFGQVIANMRKIVFSRTQKESSVPNVEVENGDLTEAISKLKTKAARILSFMVAENLYCL